MTPDPWNDDEVGDCTEAQATFFRWIMAAALAVLAAVSAVEVFR